MSNVVAFGCKGFLDMPRKIADSEPGQGGRDGGVVRLIHRVSLLTQRLGLFWGFWAWLSQKPNGICMIGNFWLWGGDCSVASSPCNVCEAVVWK